MDLVEALRAVRGHRSDEVVIATMGASREWLKLSKHPRDFIYVPSAMGQAATLGLGLALARPDLRVVVLNGDGCMLMNLGCLVTIAEQAPTTYSLVVFDNGVYEVTGGQRLAGAGHVDYVAIARAAGISQAFRCADLKSWSAGIGQVLHGDGPIFAVLDVEPITGGDVSPRAPCPMPEQIARFTAALAK